MDGTSNNNTFPETVYYIPVDLFFRFPGLLQEKPETRRPDISPFLDGKRGVVHLYIANRDSRSGAWCQLAFFLSHRPFFAWLYPKHNNTRLFYQKASLLPSFSFWYLTAL